MSDDVTTDRVRVPKTPREPTAEVRAAMDELKSARADFEASFDELNDASQSALDIPAKVRRNPVRTVALAGGAGFMLLGGPRRLVRLVAGQLGGDGAGPNHGILPADVEKVLKDAGVAKDPTVRRALEDDFADYLSQKGEYGPLPGPATSFWRTFDKVAGPLGTVTARVLVERLMEADDRRAGRRKPTSTEG
jgi:hypothetical protein